MQERKICQYKIFVEQTFLPKFLLKKSTNKFLMPQKLLLQKNVSSKKNFVKKFLLENIFRQKKICQNNCLPPKDIFQKKLLQKKTFADKFFAKK